MNGVRLSLSLLWMMMGMVLMCASTLFAQTIDFGKYHALFIANQNYKHWNILETPHNDVNRLAAILEERYGFETEILPDATRDQIVDKLEEYKELLTDHDNLLIYYAGHGKIRNDGGYWIGVNAIKNSSSKWLHYRKISDLIDFDNGMKARHVLVISDSCYAGAITRDDNILSKQRPGESDQAWFLRMQTKPSRRALTSGGTEPVIDSAGVATYSIFAQELIRRLESNAAVLEASSLFDQIKKDVHARARRIVGNDAQAPEYAPIPGTGDSGGGFLFVFKDSAVALPEPDVTGGTDFGVKGETSDTFIIEGTNLGVRGKVSDTSKLVLSLGIKDKELVTAFDVTAAIETTYTNEFGMEFVYIPPGYIWLGGDAFELSNKEKQHKVVFNKGFYIQATEMTQGQWQAVMGSNPSNNVRCGAECPVENVSWSDVQKFIAKLNVKAGGDVYSLPTEAEWEYAARAGTLTNYNTGDSEADLELDWLVQGNSKKQTHPVAQKAPNDFGLYDMHGSVWEWCQDLYSEDLGFSAVKDPQGPSNGSDRVLRGGTAYRNWHDPDYRDDGIGFRLVRLPGQ